MILAKTLKVGDKFHMRGVEVTVLQNAEPWTDPFGRSEGYFKFWCAGEGREGWVHFGPDGQVDSDG